MTAVYENADYAVLIDGESQGEILPTGYMVANKITSVIEFRDPQLANAISYAEHAHSFLKYKLWRLVGLQSASSAEFLDKQEAPHALDELDFGPKLN